MTRLITIVRHAATTNASRHIISGTLDEPLSELGRQQVRSFVDRFGHLTAELVISSPLSRAFETARLITGRRATDIEKWALCIERNYGLLQGLAPEDVAPLRPRIRYIRAGGIDHSVDPPEGETLTQVRLRARRLAAALRSRPEPTILVVSHQMLIQQLHGILTGLTLRQALAIDIAVLQVDMFDVMRGLPAVSRQIYSGERSLTSW